MGFTDVRSATKTFPNGQALGRHMRCHRVVLSQTLGSTSTSAKEAASSGRRIMDFDLNQVPPVEEGGSVGIAVHGA